MRLQANEITYGCLHKVGHWTVRAYLQVDSSVMEVTIALVSAHTNLTCIEKFFMNKWILNSQKSADTRLYLDFSRRSCKITGGPIGEYMRVIPSKKHKHNLWDTLPWAIKAKTKVEPQLYIPLFHSRSMRHILIKSSSCLWVILTQGKLLHNLQSQDTQKVIHKNHRERDNQETTKKARRWKSI